MKHTVFDEHRSIHIYRVFANKFPNFELSTFSDTFPNSYPMFSQNIIADLSLPSETPLLLQWIMLGFSTQYFSSTGFLLKKTSFFIVSSTWYSSGHSFSNASLDPTFLKVLEFEQLLIKSKKINWIIVSLVNYVQVP